MGSNAQTKFYSFVSGLQGPDYRDKIIKAYPNTELTFVSAGKLPYIGEGRVWVCECGCGERDPILIPYITSSVCAKESVKSARIEGIWVSPCTIPGSDPEEGIRHYGMEVWDEETDDLADVKFRLEGN